MLGNEPILGERPHGVSDYLREVRNLNVRHVGAIVIAPRSDLNETRKMNDTLLKLCNESKGRFFPVCSVHPLDGSAALQEIDRIARLGARALKLHPNTQNFDVSNPLVEQVVREASKNGLPVLFDAWSPFDADQPGKFVKLAMQVPEAKLILAHAHGSRFPDLLVYEILARYPWWRRNVWIDLSATASLFSGGPFAVQLAWVLRKVGIDRLLFGSDYPLDNPRGSVQAVIKLGFKKEELAKIFHENATKLLRL